MCSMVMGDIKMEMCVCNLEVIISQKSTFSYIAFCHLLCLNDIIAVWSQTIICTDAPDRFCKRFLTCHILQFTFCQRSLPRYSYAATNFFEYFKLNYPIFPPFLSYKLHCILQAKSYQVGIVPYFVSVRTSLFRCLNLTSCTCSSAFLWR